jgi:hypothetical protein
MKNILVILPTARDKRELDILKNKYGYNFLYYGINPRNCLKEFDARSFVKNTIDFAKKNNIISVIATHDYPAAIIGSIISEKLNLPAPQVEKILICQHKYLCRQYQKKYVPDAYVKSRIIDPFKKTKAPFDFPFFIKPVKSFFSIMAAQINNISQYNDYILKAKNHIYAFSTPLNDIFKNYSNYKCDANYLIAEKLIYGKQVTLEAYSYKKDIHIIGIVDSIMHKNKISFKRFDYPSNLNRDIKLKMEKIAREFIKKLGFGNGILNIEFFYDPDIGSIKIIEINPRMCSQFADLMEKVNGINTYEILLLISLDIDPSTLDKEKNIISKNKYASSFVLRQFKDKKITALPSKKQIDKVKKIYPAARIEIYGKENHMLSDELNDMSSFRYGIINLGADSKKELHSKYKTCLDILDFKFEQPGYVQLSSFLNQ